MRESDAFVAVDVVTTPSTMPIEIVTRAGHRLSVSPGFDEQHAARVLRVLLALDARC